MHVFSSQTKSRGLLRSRPTRRGGNLLAGYAPWTALNGGTGMYLGSVNDHPIVGPAGPPTPGGYSHERGLIRPTRVDECSSTITSSPNMGQSTVPARGFRMLSRCPALAAEHSPTRVS